MLGKTHKIGGICAGIITTSVLLQATDFSQEAVITAPLLIASATVGSLIPDIDHPNSKLGSRIRPVSKLINKMVGHRGFTHTIFALLILSFGLFMLNMYLPVSLQPYGWAVVIGTVVGYASHLFLDVLTPSGVPLFAPFMSKSIRLARLTTGKYDTLVSVAMIVMTGLFLYVSFPLPFA